MFKLSNRIFAVSFVAGLTALAIISAPSLARAQDDSDTSETTMGYDAIVDQLNRENAALAATSHAKAVAAQPSTESSLDNVVMHAGIGFANFVQGLRFDDGTATTINQKGIQGALGIDLFSPNWMAEGTLRSFGEDGDANLRASVHEFELKSYYKNRLNERFGYRAGLGITGRYLTVKRGNESPIEYTTPMTVATLGGDAFVTDRVSFGADISARNALIGETIDHSSYDLTIRVDAHF